MDVFKENHEENCVYSQTPLCQTLDSLNHSHVYHLDYPYIGIDDKGKDRDVHDKFSRKINK